MDTVTTRSREAIIRLQVVATAKDWTEIISPPALPEANSKCWNKVVKKIERLSRKSHSHLTLVIPLYRGGSVEYAEKSFSSTRKPIPISCRAQAIARRAAQLQPADDLREGGTPYARHAPAMARTARFRPLHLSKRKTGARFSTLSVRDAALQESTCVKYSRLLPTPQGKPGP